MIPKEGDIVRLNKEFVDILARNNDDSWITSRGVDLCIRDVTYEPIHCVYRVTWNIIGTISGYGCTWLKPDGSLNTGVMQDSMVCPYS